VKPALVALRIPSRRRGPSPRHCIQAPSNRPRHQTFQIRSAQLGMPVFFRLRIGFREPGKSERHSTAHGRFSRLMPATPHRPSSLPIQFPRRALFARMMAADVMDTHRYLHKFEPPTQSARKVIYAHNLLSASLSWSPAVPYAQAPNHHGKPRPELALSKQPPTPFSARIAADEPKHRPRRNDQIPDLVLIIS